MVSSIDAVDGIVDDLRQWRPDLDAVGLPIVGRVLRLAQLLQAEREQQLSPFGLSVADFDVLASLRRRAGTGANNVGELQRAMMLSSGGVTKRLDRLEAAKLVERHPDPADRRGVLISLTPTGLELIDDVIVAITSHENDLVTAAVATQRDRRALRDGLRRLLATLEGVAASA